VRLACISGDEVAVQRQTREQFSLALEGSDLSELSLFEHLAKIEIGNKQVTALQNTDVAPRVNLTHRDPS